MPWIFVEEWHSYRSHLAMERQLSFSQSRHVCCRMSQSSNKRSQVCLGGTVRAAPGSIPTLTMQSCSSTPRSRCNGKLHCAIMRCKMESELKYNAFNPLPHLFAGENVVDV